VIQKRRIAQQEEARPGQDGGQNDKDCFVLLLHRVEANNSMSKVGGR